ncbi:MAG TPA: response regulator transcription factor [Actinomycetota bacterium]
MTPTDDALSGRTPRVLLVDDDQENRSALRELLELEGIDVVGEAPDGTRGFALAVALDPDVVLMDLRMPELSGIEATRLIREACPRTQVVILTYYEGPLPERSAEQVGAFAYLVKGCSPAFMRQVIHQACHRAEQHRSSAAGS